MKALFVVTGIGYGDSTREHVNISALKKAFPRSKVVVAGYDKSYDYFKSKYETVEVEGYKLPGKKLKIQLHKFILSNLLLPLFWFTSTLKVKLKKFDFKPDIIVSDFEPIGISLAGLLGKKCIVVFGYDPLLYKEYKKKNRMNIKMRTEATYFEYLYNNANMVVIPSLRKPRKSLEYAYVNPIVRQLPNELKSQKELMKELNLVKKPILVMLGGSEFGTKLATYINKLADEFKEEFIIFGANMDLNWSSGVKYRKFSNNFLKYLKVSKGLITLGGQITLAEGLVYKKPILCYPIKDHVEQVLNAYSVRNVVMVGKDSSFKGVRKTLTSFLRDLPKLKKKVEKYNLKAKGENQFVDIVKIALEK
jgi:uncharacterized protein (TIGR00661 family)